MVRALAFFGALIVGAPASAGCHLALALALDVSSSVDEAEYRLQRDGLALALLSEEVQAHLFLSESDWIALAVYEWSGSRQQQIVLDWVAIRSPEVLTDVVEQIATSTRSHDDFPTALGYALGYGATLLERAPQCDRKTIDVSGDGISNDGFSPALAYNAFPFDGVTVNGLVIGGGILEVEEFYTREVIRGTNAFVETATSYLDFEDAMRRKLMREIGVRAVGQIPSTPTEG
ncbi:DUF1194 domain-containing protein [Aliiroseovarius sp. YM-037]|uniref:DUF1194 domain-containing protein n=1 Tax=Aliiroseovarius sp. YM-037 TaxID=3341728 RepID=UPI003A800B39